VILWTVGWRKRSPPALTRGPPPWCSVRAGGDSIALLDLLNMYAARGAFPFAATVDHRLRRSRPQEAAMVAINASAAWRFPETLAVVDWDGSETSRTKAAKARYQHDLLNWARGHR